MDTEALDKMALRLEADAHRHGGWDGPAGFFVVYEHADVETERAYAEVLGPPVRVHPHTARTPVPSLGVGPAPNHAVFRMAANLKESAEHPLIAQFLAKLRQPGFVGVALAFEGWQWDGDPEERAALGDRSLADVPGSRETRMVALATHEGTLHIAQRIRGEKPAIAEGWTGSTGAVPESLLVIAAVVAGKPAPELTCTPVGYEG